MLFHHSSIYLLAKLIPGLMAFTALSFYSHLLEPNEYGTYTLIITGTMLIHNVVYLWISSATLRFWSSGDYSNKIFISTLGVTYRNISLVILFFLSIPIIYYWKQQEMYLLITAYLFLQALTLFTITQNLYMAKIKPSEYAYMTISYSIMALVFGSFFAYIGFSVQGILFGISLGFLLPSLFVFKDTWTLFDPASYDKHLLKKLSIYGLPMASAFLLEEITKLTDRFMLAALIDKSQAGFYGIASELSGNSVFMIMSAINMAAYPVIIKLFEEKGEKEAVKHFRFYSILLLGISLPAVIGLNLVGPDLITLIIDSKYQKTVIFLLPWITAGMFMMGLQAFYFDLAFQLGKKVIYILKISIFIATLNLILNYWLIPIMGIQGAALATLLSFSLSSLISFYFSRRAFPLPLPYKEFIKIIISSFVMGVCLWWLQDLRGWGWLTIQILTGIISYAAMMVIFNILDVRILIRDKISVKLQSS